MTSVIFAGCHLAKESRGKKAKKVSFAKTVLVLDQILNIANPFFSLWARQQDFSLPSGRTKKVRMVKIGGKFYLSISYVCAKL